VIHKSIHSADELLDQYVSLRPIALGNASVARRQVCPSPAGWPQPKPGEIDIG